MPADYRTKYIEMRAKFIEASDIAYRLGFEEGMKEGQQAAEQAVQQQQMDMQAQQAAMQGMPPEAGGPENPEMAAQEGQMDQLAPEELAGEDVESGSELDSQISELEGLVAKGQKPSVLDMRKAVESLSTLRKSQRDQWAKKRAKTISVQKKFVDNILNKWEKETKDVTEGLEEIVKESGIKLD